MSLAKAVLEIADEMWTTATSQDEQYPFLRLGDFAKQLRLVVEAVENETPKQVVDGYVDDRGRWHSSKKEVSQKVLETEDHSGRVIEVVGGPADNSFFPVTGQVPEGGQTAIAGGVYQYRQGKLYYMEAEKSPKVEI